MPPDSPPLRTPAWVAQSILGLGFLGALLLLAARIGELPPGLCSRILANSPVWGLASAGLFGLGVWLLWMGAHARTSWKPAAPGQRFHSLVLYTRQSCPLCDDAAAVLARYRGWLPPAVEVDIDSTPELLSRFQESIPVVELDGRIRFLGCVNEVLLRRLIEGTPPLSSRNRRSPACSKS